MPAAPLTHNIHHLHQQHLPEDTHRRHLHPSSSASASSTPSTDRPPQTTMLTLSSAHAQSQSQSQSQEQESFAPYKPWEGASTAHQRIKKSKYATSVDERGYLSVYEFQLNEQTIMWDYTTGFVHLTGIWKALGNSKADIVRLVDNHPELEGVIRRIRGGFLKIQGTWVPYDLAVLLARRTCWTIRFALITLFGPTFPEECLQPDAVGYGSLTLSTPTDTKKRRKRKLFTAALNPPPTGREGMSEAVQKRQRTLQTRRTSFHKSILPPSPVSPASSYTAPTYRPYEQPPRDYRGEEIPRQSIPELLDLLRASRCLQKISAGFHSFDWAQEAQPANFECDGLNFRWDGHMTGTGGLSIVDHGAPPSLSSSDFGIDNEADTEETYPDNDSEYMDHDRYIGAGAGSSRRYSDEMMKMPPLTRKFSSADSDHHHGAITPPNSSQMSKAVLHTDHPYAYAYGLRRESVESGKCRIGAGIGMGMGMKVGSYHPVRVGGYEGDDVFHSSIGVYRDVNLVC